MNKTADNQQVSPKTHITIRGARVHNLKNVTVSFPRNKMIVITGLSGSGKSSLAFDTLYAEGQRRYVESLSSYARQFLGRLDKPDVDAIEGISPAIAIEQRVTGRSSRSTVGTSTEIYDYLKLLFARIGKTYSPISGKEVKRHTATDVVNYVQSLPVGTRYMVLSPIAVKGKSIEKQLDLLVQQGFSRVRCDGEIVNIDSESVKTIQGKNLHLVIDRLQVTGDVDDASRIADSVEAAFFEGRGECFIAVPGEKDVVFSNRFELDGMTFEDPNPNFFSFNNPIGACKRCEGFGQVIGIDEDLVIPNPSLSVYDDAVQCWKGEVMSDWKLDFIRAARATNFPVHKPYSELSEEQRQVLWNGKGGINAFFSYLEEKSYKIQYRVMLSRYRGKTTCPDCHGTRLRKDASYVKINGHGISQLVLMPASDLLGFILDLPLSKQEEKIAGRLLTEIRNRLQYLCDVGLGYITLNRLSNTLSGGESQRISLSTCLGSSLVGSTYVLDEPSIGLHPRDTHRLIKVLKALRDLGNTVVVVEHDEEIMKAADMLIDIGPMAGVHGGEVVFSGTHDQLMASETSLTARFLTGRETIDRPKKLRPVKDFIHIRGARENNLKNIDVSFPLHCLCVVTGVSGSGKSTLVTNILYPAMNRHLGNFTEQPGKFNALEGDIKQISAIEYIDQNPIGKSSRSNPVTYVKAWDEVRSIFASVPLSKNRMYKPGHFSFNTEGGRCETCFGEGRVTIEMQFMADITLQCETCKGKRFKDDVLEVTYHGKNINDILEMSVDEALEFFRKDEQKTQNRKFIDKLTPLQEVGLGYIGLGQSSNTLSGGEAQRIKLASFLNRGETKSKTLFIFDEPTTGLHFYDVKKLLVAFQALIAQGHSLIVIEHNTDVIKSADWIIDLGPDAGLNGGELVFAGTPDDLVKSSSSITSTYMKEKIG
ncbi:MAG: excinuclease subunit UvrA [Bacteroidota bacterium]